MKRFNCLSDYNHSGRPRSSMLLMGVLFLALIPAQARNSALANVKGSESDAREVVNMLVAQNFEGVRAHFNQVMKDGLSADRMREVWNAAIQYHGQFKSQGAANQSQDQGYDVFIIKCEMERSPMEVVVAYDQSGSIGGLWVRPARG